MSLPFEMLKRPIYERMWGDDDKVFRDTETMWQEYLSFMTFNKKSLS